MNAQTPLDRVVLLWASTKLNGLLTHDQQNKIVEETVAKQRDDGGFSMSQLIGAWKRHDDTPLDTSSDGYATGSDCVRVGAGRSATGSGAAEAGARVVEQEPD
jgi:hypothetical protein